MKSLSQVIITVIGSDSRKAAGEGAFENCRLVVDASVYIWLSLSSPSIQPTCDFIRTDCDSFKWFARCLREGAYTDQFHLCVTFSVYNARLATFSQQMQK